MENTNGFYKHENGELFYAPNFVECTEYKLLIEDYLNYTFPIDGWYYFESKAEARGFFGIVDEIIV